MKKIIIITITLATVFTAKSQISFGVKGGFNVTNFRGADVDNNKGKIGFHLGVTANVDLKNNLYLKPGLIYSQQGAKQTDLGGSANLNANYLNIPVLIGHHFNQGFYAETGPQLGVLMSANVKASGEKISIKDQFNKTDLSWAFGGGYMATENIGVELHYNLGLNTIANGGDAKAYNSVLQVGVVYHFNKN